MAQCAANRRICSTVALAKHSNALSLFISTNDITHMCALLAPSLQPNANYGIKRAAVLDELYKVAAFRVIMEYEEQNSLR